MINKLRQSFITINIFLPLNSSKKLPRSHFFYSESITVIKAITIFPLETVEKLTIHKSLNTIKKI